MATDQELLSAFAERLGKTLEERKLNQAELGRAIKVHPNAVSGWVRGKRWPRMENLLAIASTLGVTVDWLVAGKARASASAPQLGPAHEVTRELARLAPALADLANRARQVTAAE